MKISKITIKKSIFLSNSFVGVGVVILVALQVFFAVQASAYGAKLAQLEEERLSIAKQNDDISRTLVESTSLTKIQERSESLGFAKPAQMIYVNPEESVAKLP